MKFKEFQHKPVKPDTYEASMALNQLMRIGKHAVKLHNMIDDAAEMESWVAKKIDLAGDYVKKVYNYTEGEKAGLYDDGGMSEMKKMPKGTGTMYGVKEDAGSLTDEQKKGLDMINKKYGNRVGGNGDSLPQGYMLMRLKTGVGTDGIDDQEMSATLKKYGHDSMYDAEQADDDFYEKIYNKKHLPITIAMVDDLAKVMGTDFDNDQKLSDAYDYLYNRDESVSEDAGEGHMSKSTLYHTAKYAIELMDMIKPGDDLEGWVQSKLNKAADYLQGVYNYEEYQKLNPYREDLDSNVLQKHAQVVQKNIDEILEKETELDDIDTKPGMMRILAKRVNEVEKEMAKENRKNTDEAHGGKHTTSGRSMTKGEMNKREKIVKGMKKNKAGFKKRYGKDAEAVMYATATKNAMKEKEFNPNDERDEAPREGDIVNHKDLGKVSIMKVTGSDQMGQPAEYIIQAKLSYDELMGDVELGKFESTNESGILYRAGVKKYGKAGMKAIQSAAGKGASHQEIGKIKDKHLKDEEDLDEGIKDWAKNLAAAGVIVGAVAGMGSIQNAIDNTVPAVKAMNTAYEMAMDAGNNELAKNIKNDISAVKVRLDSGKDLDFVKAMQDKYSKFIQTEGLTYESQLALALNQRLK